MHGHVNVKLCFNKIQFALHVSIGPISGHHLVLHIKHSDEEYY